MHTVYICICLYRVPHACLHTHVYTPHSTHAPATLIRSLLSPGRRLLPHTSLPRFPSAAMVEVKSTSAPVTPWVAGLGGTSCPGAAAPPGPHLLLLVSSRGFPSAGSASAHPLLLPAPRSSPPHAHGMGPTSCPSRSPLPRPTVPLLLTPSLEPGHLPALSVCHRSTPSGTLCSGTV